MRSGKVATAMTPILLGLLSGCSRQEPIADYQVDVDLLKVQEVSVSELFKGVEVIPLESKDSAYLNVSCLSGYQIAGDQLFVMDKANNAVVLFSLDGEWLGTLSKQGRGPGEYVMLTDMDYNFEQRSIDILEATGRVLSYATEKGFPLIRELGIPNDLKSLVYFKSVPSGYYLYSGYSRSVLYYYDIKRGQVYDVAGIPEVEQNRRAGYKTAGSPFYNYNEEVFYTDGATGGVYRLAGKDAEPHIIWNLGRFSFKPGIVDADKTGTSYEQLKVASNAMAGPFSNVRETSKCVFTSALFMGRSVNIIYNKSSKAAIAFGRTSEGLIFSPGVVSNNAMYLLVPPEIAVQLIPEELTKDITDDSNYLLIKYLL